MSLTERLRRREIRRKQKSDELLMDSGNLASSRLLLSRGDFLWNAKLALDSKDYERSSAYATVAIAESLIELAKHREGQEDPPLATSMNFPVTTK